MADFFQTQNSTWCLHPISTIFDRVQVQVFHSIDLGPMPLQAYTHPINNALRYTYTWKQRIGMAGRIVNLTPFRLFNALAPAFNGYCNIILLTNQHVLIYYPCMIFFQWKTDFSKFCESSCNFPPITFQKFQTFNHARAIPVIFRDQPFP